MVGGLGVRWGWHDVRAVRERPLHPDRGMGVGRLSGVRRSGKTFTWFHFLPFSSIPYRRYAGGCALIPTFSRGRRDLAEGRDARFPSSQERRECVGMARSGKLLIWLHFVAFPSPEPLTLRPLPEGQGAGMRGSRLRGKRRMLFVRTTYANNVASGGSYGAMGCCRWFFTLIPAFSRGRRELQGPGIRGFRLRGNDGANRPYIHTGTRVRGAVA